MPTGGALEDVPKGRKVFAVAAVAGAAMLAVSAVLLLKDKKAVCTLDVYGGTPQKVEAKLDAACGRPVPLNSGRDASYVLFLASGTFVALVWAVVTIVALKQYLWDVLKKRSSRGVDTGVASYATFGSFGLVCLLLALRAVVTAVGRTCRGVPPSHCRSKTYNDDLKGWLSVPTIVFGLLTLAPLWAVFRSSQYLE